MEWIWSTSDPTEYESEIWEERSNKGFQGWSNRPQMMTSVGWSNRPHQRFWVPQIPFSIWVCCYLFSRIEKKYPSNNENPATRSLCDRVARAFVVDTRPKPIWIFLLEMCGEQTNNGFRVDPFFDGWVLEWISKRMIHLQSERLRQIIKNIWQILGGGVHSIEREALFSASYLVIASVALV